jgi:serralysin
MSTPATEFDTPKGGLYGGPFNPAGLDPNVIAQIMNERWVTSFGGSVTPTTMTYSFPTSAADYTSVPGYNDADLIASFQALTDFQKDAVRTGFNLITSYTGVTFQEVASGLAEDATFRFARYNNGGSEARFPTNDGSYFKVDARVAGDVFLGTNGTPLSAAFFGTDEFTTIIHEMGHAFGLKHGHDDSFNGALASFVNDNEFSVMTYASYFGADTNGATVARDGSSPQSYMMYDIAALQALYGANFSKVGTAETYTWDSTGRQFINGAQAPNTGVSTTNMIFTTVWTQGATVTYDFSNFSQDQIADLRPGSWSRFSDSQLADLNADVPANTTGFIAQGNVYNALLYQGDMRSLVANLITGSGNDKLVGNDRDNVLTAGDGIDVIITQGGNDTVIGGAGADIITFGWGRNTLRDTVANLDGDKVSSFGFGAVDIRGAHIVMDDLAVTANKVTATVGASTFELFGRFDPNVAQGEFIIAARGLGNDAYTTMTFVNYLPTLSEGVRVDAGSINGIASQAFLTGTGALHYMLDFRSAVSTYANTVGYYLVGADGRIGDVNILFANSHGVAAGTQVDLGTPAGDVGIGFFLIQDGFDFYGSLPDDLSFLTPNVWTPADVNAGQAPVLWSQSRGVLTVTEIFHSFASLNPGQTTQVLSGVLPGGQGLQIGFEDLPSTSGDNDYQDVILGIWLV